MNVKKGVKKKEEKKDDDNPIENEPKTFNNQAFITKLISFRKEKDILNFLSEELMQKYNRFAIEHEFDVQKSIFFLHLMNEVLEFCKRKENSETKTIEFAKQLLKDYSVIVNEPKLQIINEKSDEKIENVNTNKKLNVKKKSSSRLNKKSKNKGKESSEKREEVKNDEVESKANRVFNDEELRDITKYITTGILQHFHLYQFMFNSERPKRIFKEKKFLSEMKIPEKFESFLTEVDFLEKQKKEEEEREKEREKKRKEKELLEKQEEEERLRKIEEEKERKNAPKLTESSLVEVSEYLKFHLLEDFNKKQEGYLQRIENLKQKISFLLEGNAPEKRKSKSRQKK